jgi:radical SAM superfamily enzyme YgiQ (UPF0313 family)
MNILVLVPSSRFTKNVARDLVYGCWCKGKRIAGIQFPPLTSVLVATVLRNDGNKVTFQDSAATYKTTSEITKIAADKDMAVVLTSTMTINEDAQALLELKKVNPRLVTVVFGSHPTFLPKETLKREGIDIAVRREAEYIIRDLARAIKANDGSCKTIAGIAYKENGQVVINNYYPLINNLDELPFPDRDMLSPAVSYFNPVVKQMPFTTIYTTRGCPGKCIFCSSPSFYGNHIRFRSAQNILEELYLIKQMGYREVFFRDEFFPVSKERTIAVCEAMLREKLKLSWICSARIGTVDFETMKLMRAAGCHMLRFGVESGVQEILNNIKKEIRIETTLKTFADANKLGLSTHAHMMLGMPGETKETINESIKFVKKIKPQVVTFGVMIPYPGTQIYEEVKKLHPEIGDASSCDLSRLHTQSYFNEVFTSVSKEDLKNSIRRAYREFYLRPQFLFSWLKRVNSLEQLIRVILAGRQVFSFIEKGD